MADMFSSTLSRCICRRRCTKDTNGFFTALLPLIVLIPRQRNRRRNGGRAMNVVQNRARPRSSSVVIIIDATEDEVVE